MREANTEKMTSFADDGKEWNDVDIIDKNIIGREEQTHGGFPFPSKTIEGEESKKQKGKDNLV